MAAGVLRVLDRRRSRRGWSCCRWCSTTSWSRAPSASRCARVDGAGQARRDLRSQRPAARLQRRRRHHLRGPDRDRRRGEDRRGAVRARSTTATEEVSATSCSSGWSQPRAFVYVKRRRATPMQAKRVAALELEGIGFTKESRRFYPNRELAAHLLGYVGVDNVGLGGIEADLRQGGARPRGQAAGADRRAAARLQPARALADRRRLDRADHRRAAAVHRRARAARRRRRQHAPTAAPPSSWIRTPARSWRWRAGRRSTPTTTATRRRRRGAIAPCRTSTSPDRPSSS